MKILITGSTGFVGRNLVPKLIKNGHQILELTRSVEKSKKLYGLKTLKFKITNNQELLTKKIIDFEPEIVIHLASYLSSSDDYETMKNLIDSNIIFLSRLLDSISKVNLKLFINTGTFAEYFKGDGVFEPAYLYAATKTASRSFLDYYSTVCNFKQATVVPYTIYGEQDTKKKIIDLIYDSITNPTPLDLSPGEQVLDFIHIDDVTDFYLSLIQNIEKLPTKSNFQLGTGIGHTLKQVTAIIEEVIQRKTNINWGGKSYRKSDVMYAVADNSKMINILNFRPKVIIDEGIKTYIKNKAI